MREHGYRGDAAARQQASPEGAADGLCHRAARSQHGGGALDALLGRRRLGKPSRRLIYGRLPYRPGSHPNLGGPRSQHQPDALGIPSPSTCVCRSSLAAEVQAPANAEQELFFARLAWSEIGEGRLIDAADPVPAVRTVRGVIAVDAKSIYDSMHGASGPLEITEKRTAIEMVGIQQSFKAEDVILRWVHSESNLADSLTKDSAEEPLRTFLSGKQRWRLVQDPLMRSTRRRKQDGLRTLEGLATCMFDSRGHDLSASWNFNWPRRAPDEHWAP